MASCQSSHSILHQMKLAICISGWHFPLHFYQELKNQILPEGWEMEVFCIAHRRPSEAHDKDLKSLDDSHRADLDRILYHKIANEKDLRKLTNYKLYPNTIGDWGCSNQWLENHNYEDYDAFLFTHDDNLITNPYFLHEGIRGLERYDIVSNSVGLPAGWLRGSCEFFSKNMMEKLGGKFDLSMTTLTREGKTDNPEGTLELNDWNTTVYPMMKFIEDNKIKVGFLSPFYRVSQYCIEGERGWIHRTHAGNTEFEEQGLEEYYGEL